MKTLLTGPILIKGSVTVFLGVGLVSLYSILLPYAKYNASGFKRTIRSNMVLQTKSLELKNPEHLYLAGACAGKLYLSNEATPLNVLEIADDLCDYKEIKIDVDQNFDKGYVQVDSPFFYAGDKSGSNLLRGYLTDWKARRTSLRIPPFLQLACIDSTKIVLHTTIGRNAGHTENIIGQVRMDTPNIILNRDLLDEQKEGIYSTDGMLRYNQQLRRVIFIYFYRNEIVTVDTELGRISRFNTIDTTRIAQLNTVAIGANSFSLTTPPLVINKNARCYKQYLLIHSEVVAQNERIEDFHRNMVIDVYDLRKGAYCFSYYLPKEEDQEIENFYIVKDKIVVLTGNELISYDLSQEDFTGSSRVAQKITDR